MIDFIKSHIIIILAGLILASLIAVVVVLLLPPKVTNPSITGVIPADQIALNTELTDEQRNVGLIALDYVYTYGSFSAEENRLASLDGNVTAKMKPNVDSLIAELGSNPNMFATLQPSSDSYSVDITTSNPKSATVTLNGFLTDNSVSEKYVKIVLNMVFQNDTWLLDEFNVE